MSSVRVDISPAISTRKRNISSWIEPDISRLSARGNRRYNKRKNAVKDYFTTDLTIEDITLQHHLSSEILMRLLEQCLMQHEDGRPWGYRALVPGATVIDHTPLPISEEGALPQEQLEAPTMGASEEVLDEVSCNSDRSPFDEDKDTSIEDDEDTAERPAIKISSIDVPLAPIASVSLNGHDNHQAEVLEVEGKNTAVPNKHEITVEEDVPELTDEENELATVDVDEDQEVDVANTTEHDTDSETFAAAEGLEVVVKGDSELEEVVVEGDTLANEDDEEVEDLSQLAKIEPVEDIDANEEKLDASNDDTAITEFSDTPIPATSRTQIVARENLVPAVLPLYGKSRKHIDVKKIAQTRRSIRKRWIQDVQNRRKQRRLRSIVATTVVASLMFVIFIPLGTGLAAYSTYNSIRNVALDGVNHLLTVKNLLPISKSDLTAALDAQKLQQAQSEFSSAESDFVQLQQLVNRSDVQSAIQQFAPQYSSKLDMAQRLVQVGIDVSRMGKEVVGVALLGASIIHSSPLANGTTKPLISSTDISNAEGVMIHAQYFINDIQLQMSQVSLKDLPISDTQKKQLSSVLALMPKAQDLITQGQGLIGIVSWLLGVDQARHFLVQTMDSGELRPGGGFTGMYGLLTIQNGRMAPFSLQDVTELDYAGNGMELGRQAPPQYSSWMKFGYFGLRDANLSGDFPTTAKLAMQVFQEEGGGPVDGNIALTPTVIAHVLNVIGPIKVPQYNETITAQNLEDKLHYYQQDFGAIRLQRQITGTNNAATRKAFTSLLGHLLLDKVRHEPVKVLVKIMQNAVKDIQSRDLEIYFTNPLAEGWMIQHGYSDATDTFSKQDGFMVVQSNISISKASQYVHTTEQDNISFDAQGGAYHNLTITLDYKQTGPVYGFDTYADYIRVYAPANAQLQGGNGFDTGHCLTPAPNQTGTGGVGTTGTGGTGNSCCNSNPVPKPTGGNGNPPPPVVTGSQPDPCAQYATSYPSDVRYCPDGNYSLGLHGGTGNYWPVDSLGPPTEVTTDLPGRAMWGGLTLTPKNCISTITLQWYVPNVIKHISGQPSYAILVQKQGGYIPTVQIAIDSSAIPGLKPFNFQGDIVADRLFSLSSPKKT
ncbi:MAG TPA: DUF4012 domain-containing protein [Ktedonobacteraceae bacterium]